MAPLPIAIDHVPISVDRPRHVEVSRGAAEKEIEVVKSVDFSEDFVITAYTAGPESTGKKPGDIGYGITASGTVVKENHTVAADWNILPPGTQIEIEGLPYIYTVEDRGGAIKGNRIDLYVADLDDAIRWGKQIRKVRIIE